MDTAYFDTTSLRPFDYWPDAKLICCLSNADIQRNTRPRCSLADPDIIKPTLNSSKHIQPPDSAEAIPNRANGAIDHGYAQ